MRVNGNLKFLSKYSATVPKSTPKRLTTKGYKNTRQLVSREPKEVPLNDKNPTQKPKLESEHRRERNGPNNTKLEVADSLLQYPRLSAVQKT
jgi:hypothetical protein